jgi:hypothetical protein
MTSYRRIHGELAKLGVAVAASTVYEVLRAAGAGTARRQFLHAQAAGSWRWTLFTWILSR